MLIAKKGKVRRLGLYSINNNRFIVVFFYLFFAIAILFSPNLVKGQDSTISAVIKPTDFWNKKSLVKPKYPAYPLMAGFLLVKEANLGDPFAQHELGIRYIMGNGFPSDTLLGISWLKKAVNSKIPAAHFNYAIMCINGTGVEWNPFEAFWHIKQSALGGLPEGQYLLGVFYIDNLIVSRNINNAFYWLEKSSMAGFVAAKQIMDDLVKSGYSKPVFKKEDSENPGEVSDGGRQTTILDSGLEPDYLEFEDDSTSNKKEEIFVENFNNKNINEIKAFIGCKIDTADTDIDTLKAKNIILKAASFGSPEALFIVAEKYGDKNSSLVDKASGLLSSLRLGYNFAFFNLSNLINTNEFKSELQKKVNKKEPNALYVLAQLRLLNLNLEVTFDSALEFLKLAAEKNNINALNEIGVNFYGGKYFEKDKQQALKYWEKAVSLGDNEAKQRIIFTKMVDDRDNLTVEDVRYIQSSSDCGAVLSETALGLAYQKGLFLPVKKAMAVQLYRKASGRGNGYAFSLLKNLYDEIRPDSDEFVLYNEE